MYKFPEHGECGARFLPGYWYVRKAEFVKKFNGTVLVTARDDHLMASRLQACDAVPEKMHMGRVSDIQQQFQC